MLANDIQKEIWTKFLFITSISGLGALTRASVGEMLESPFDFITGILTQEFTPNLFRSLASLKISES